MTWDEVHVTKAEVLLSHERAVDSQLEPLTRDVIESRAKTTAEYDELYSKVAMLLVLRSGLGACSDPAAMKQTARAMQSVFPQGELVKFMRQSRIDKRGQLRQLSRLVAGIR